MTDTESTPKKTPLGLGGLRSLWNRHTKHKKGNPNSEQMNYHTAMGRSEGKHKVTQLKPEEETRNLQVKTEGEPKREARTKTNPRVIPYECQKHGESVKDRRLRKRGERQRRKYNRNLRKARAN